MLRAVVIRFGFANSLFAIEVFKKLFVGAAAVTEGTTEIAFLDTFQT